MGRPVGVGAPIGRQEGPRATSPSQSGPAGFVRARRARTEKFPLIGARNQPNPPSFGPVALQRGYFAPGNITPTPMALIHLYLLPSNYGGIMWAFGGNGSARNWGRNFDPLKTTFPSGGFLWDIVVVKGVSQRAALYNT